MKITIVIFFMIITTLNSVSQSDSTIKVDSIHYSTYTLNLLPLIETVLQFDYERKLADNFSVCGLIAFGMLSDNYNNGLKHSFFCIGTQLNWYFKGNFDNGLRLGLQVYFSSSGSDNVDPIFFDYGKITGIIPFIGFKSNSSTNFTFDGKFGFGFAYRELINKSGNIENKSKIIKVGLLSFNIGWSN
ncbi:MAG: hypothetical protein EPN82_00325 [Bacteroidetes bacterium]|nr:MAG: hypothetical protein EPN82_00325 [Bacteroidota bacterium]